MDKMLTEELHGEHAFTVGGFSPFTVGHQSVAKDMHKAGHSSVSVYTTTSTKRPITSNEKTSFIKKAVPRGTNVGSAATPFHALSDMYSKGMRGNVTFYGGSDRKNIVYRLKIFNNKEGGHGFYKFDNIKFKQVGEERKEGATGIAGVSGTKARAAKSPEELKQYLPKELHKDAVKIYNAINEPKSKKSLRERYLANEIFSIMELVETKNGEVGEIVYKGSNYVTIQLPDNTTTKAWIYEIEEAKQYKQLQKQPPLPIKTIPMSAPSANMYKLNVRSKAPKIPALLIPKKGLMEASGQISYEDYTTKNFDICPGAQKHFINIVNRKDLNPKYVKQAMMALDKMFAIEKQAMHQTADSSMTHDFTMYATIAHDTLNLLGYSDKDITYIDDHYLRFAKLINHHDASLADEPGSHLTSSGGEVDEAAIGQRTKGTGLFPKYVYTADKTVNAAGIKKPTKRILSQRKLDTDQEKEDEVDKMLKKKNVPVYEGIEKVMGPDIMPGKPVGLHSFRAFMDITEPIRGDIAAEKESAKNAATEVGSKHGAGYKMMRKAKLMDL